MYDPVTGKVSAGVTSLPVAEGSQDQPSFAVGDLFSMFDELEAKVKAYECMCKVCEILETRCTSYKKARN